VSVADVLIGLGSAIGRVLPSERRKRAGSASETTPPPPGYGRSGSRASLSSNLIRPPYSGECDGGAAILLWFRKGSALNLFHH